MPLFSNKILKLLAYLSCNYFDKTNTGLGMAPKKATEQNDQVDKQGIYCKACHTKISHPSHAFEMQSSHLHVFTNPEGVTFEIGLYAKADCLASGPMILEHTWFAGYAWQVALCPGCQIHLGWRYSQAHAPAFYGLILSRLKLTGE
jgi:hypothetical protein